MMRTLAYQLLNSRLVCSVFNSKYGTIFETLKLSSTLVRSNHTGTFSRKRVNFCASQRTLPNGTANLSLSVTRGMISRKDYKFPEVKEEDLEEAFVRGSGPGGQAVNQTANCVVLKHLPSGIVVKCHETRSLDKNRARARRRLQERLDLHINGENSLQMVQKREGSSRRAEKKRRSRQRLEMKKAFKDMTEND